jgi:transposase
MRAYSTDLRERVAAACDAGDATREQIADRFSVSVSWIRKLMRQRRRTGSIGPRPHGGGHPRAFDAEADGRLRAAVRADDDATLEELARAAGVACCPSAVHRALARLGITRKKSRGGRPSRIAPS